MKKFLRIVLTGVVALVALVLAGLLTTTIVNTAASASEATRIEDYGQRVEVDGRRMNVQVAGEGDQTIVLLPGFGTGSPVLDFSPLTDELAATYRVVVVEPLGYGLSDQTDVPRTTANIVSEIHEAVSALGIDRYVLMGHSIAGIYALDYVERFRDEVTAFVGIDSSVPDQPGMDVSLPVDALRAAKALGITRLVTALSGDPYPDPPYEQHTREQLGMISQRNTSSATSSDEMSRIAANFRAAKGKTFPSDLPVLLFVQRHNPTVEGWLPLHEDQAASVIHGEVVPLDADHYLHHTKSPEIAAGVGRFLAVAGVGEPAVPPRG
ncbi:alpha/beta hydrolase [Plantibacter sp. VKM Ac-2880]|uniref:alpha/beta hydrolase n=1 Tax=Plantibacter sp. VKM Ac-2880 TaxID=2783827 RepID=UPI00188FA6CB|nr:alpha/beta hydrolase [Plantibacter sp. VKM Ac-2880]MBF4568621.1 alpha/beta hydrolase [Plantibacter sp. VKM Ac-2880]